MSTETSPPIPREPEAAAAPELLEQTMARVAWLYFKEGLTQAEIADLLSTNRARINKLINEARRSGLVTFKIHSQFTGCVELEQRLMADFGLERAIIVPTPQDPSLVPVMIGQAAAEYFSQLLATRSLKAVGVAWGVTIREMVRFVPSSRNPDLCVSSIIGGLTRMSSMNTFEIASDLARRLDAECAYLAAPSYADTPEDCKAILSHSEFRRVFARIAESELVVVGIGDVSRRSLMVRYGVPQDISPAELTEAGAVGAMLGQFFNAEGNLIDHEINRRVIALKLSELRRMPRVLMVAGGAYKARAIAGALRTRLGSVLVSDETTARLALEV